MKVQDALPAAEERQEDENRNGAPQPSPERTGQPAGDPHADGATESVAAPPAASEQRPSFPVASLNEGLTHLRRPFTKEAVRFKVQTVFKEAKGCIIVGYIDARLASERLNYVMGALWTDEYEALPDGLMLCRLTVDGVTRIDVGSGYKGKGLYSDALKRSAVKFGVGQSIYAIPQITLFESTHGKGDGKKGWIEKFTTAKGPSLRLTEDGIAALRNGYQKWLEATGIAQFGDPIDHGDVADSAGEEPQVVAAQEDVNDLPAVKMPLTDQKADELRLQARGIYGALKNRRAKPQARFESELAQASYSHDDLENYVKALTEMVAAQ